MGEVLKVISAIALVGFVCLWLALPELVGAVVVYVWLCFAASAPHAHGPDVKPVEEVARIQTAIVEYVDSHPRCGEMSLAELQQAGVISQRDREFIPQQHYEYRAISAASSKEATVFIRTGRDTEERWHRKSGRRQWYLSQPDDKAFTFAFPGTSKDVWPNFERTLKDNRTGQTLYSYRTDAHTGVTRWHGAGRALATIEQHRSGNDQLLVLFPDGDRVTQVRIPSDLNMIDYLPDEYRDAPPEFESQRIRYFHWLGDHLNFEWKATARLFKNGEPNGALVIDCRPKLEFDFAGNVTLFEPVKMRLTRQRPKPKVMSPEDIRRELERQEKQRG